MACCSIELSLTNLVLLGLLVLGVKKLIALYKQWKLEKMLEKFDTPSKDKVILHTTPRCKTVPSASPFAMKLETYLRLAKIPYEVETANPMGPKGKIPWISHNGTHLGDSHLCIQYLNRKLGINLNKGKSEEEVALASACRIVVEEHFLWGLIQYRWVDNLGAFSQLMSLPSYAKFFMPFLGWQHKSRMNSQGMGKHTPSEIYQMTDADLHMVSKLLGNKKYFGGDAPCEDDCAIFGGLSQAIWGMPGSSAERLVHGKGLKI